MEYSLTLGFRDVLVLVFPTSFHKFLNYTDLLKEVEVCQILFALLDGNNRGEDFPASDTQESTKQLCS